MTSRWENMWKRKSKVTATTTTTATTTNSSLSNGKILSPPPSKLTLLDPDDDLIQRVDSAVNIVVDEEEEKGLSAKDRLMDIVTKERKSAAEERLKPAEIEDEDEEESFFHRGSNLVSSVRKSLRKMMNNAENGKKRKKKHREEKAELKGDKQHQHHQCNESQDSGLGEDSDGENKTSLLSPRTPTSILLHSTSSSIRKTSSGNVTFLNNNNSSSNNSNGMVRSKHVVIREPSLPQTRIIYSQSTQRPRRATAKIYSRPSKLPLTSTLSVSPQWNRIFSAAYSFVLQNVDGCDSFIVRMIFEADQNGVKRDLEELDSVDDAAAVIHSVYKVLFYRWERRLTDGPVAIVVHSVQRFLILVVDVVVIDLDVDERLRFARQARDLLRSSEAGHYRDVVSCLERTRRVYLDLWCALLLAPFSIESGATSPVIEDIQDSLHSQRRMRLTRIQDEDEDEFEV